MQLVVLLKLPLPCCTHSSIFVTMEIKSKQIENLSKTVSSKLFPLKIDLKDGHARGVPRGDTDDALCTSCVLCLQLYPVLHKCSHRGLGER